MVDHLLVNVLLFHYGYMYIYLTNNSMEKNALQVKDIMLTTALLALVLEFKLTF